MSRQHLGQLPVFPRVGIPTNSLQGRTVQRSSETLQASVRRLNGSLFPNQIVAASE